MIIDVAAGLVFKDERLLITQRRADDHLAGLWEFPGGKVEQHETFESCLIRELREELAIEVAVHELIEEITHHYSDKSVHLKFFRCRLLSGIAKPIHCQAFAWISRDQLSTYQFPAADARLLVQLNESRQLWNCPEKNEP